MRQRHFITIVFKRLRLGEGAFGDTRDCRLIEPLTNQHLLGGVELPGDGGDAAIANCFAGVDWR